MAAKLNAMRAILAYHSIDESGSAISVASAVFHEHVQWLSARHVDVLSVDRLLDLPNDDQSNAVAITFDDGFANFSDAAALLADYGLPVTLFVVTGRVGATNVWNGRPDPGIPTLPLLGWRQLEALVESGVTIGAHTRTHASLTRLSPSAVEDEMDGCLDDLEQRLGRRPTYLAYPYGDVSDSVASAAAARFAGAMTTRFASLSGRDAPTRIPRFDMFYFRRPGALRSWGTPRFARHVWAVQMRRRAKEALT